MAEKAPLAHRLYTSHAPRPSRTSPLRLCPEGSFRAWCIDTYYLRAIIDGWSTRHATISMTSTNQADTPGKVTLPRIRLDRTLSDLYRQTCPSLSNTRIGFIFCGASCTTELSADFPRNKKYIYQDGTFNDVARAEKPDSLIRRILAPKYLSLVPQRDAFITGKEPVIFFYSGRSSVEIEHDEAEAERTLSVLDESQRAEAIFCPGPGHVSRVCADHGIGVIGAKLVVDCIADPSEGVARPTRMLTDPDTFFFLNGKEALAKSGLPTPEAEVIEVQGWCPGAANCCEECVQSFIEEDVPETCTGPRGRWIGEQTVRILAAIERHPLPFVFKNQQAFAGAGTYVVTTGPRRNQLLEDLTRGGILRRLLGRITKDNEHLRAGSMLLMTMVIDAVNDYGLTFFVGEDGSPTFLAMSEQMIDRASSAWTGSKISYPHQANLQRKFGDVMHQTAKWLHQHGYFGPAGADILETQNGEFYIVDLNVRTSGSLCLPLLQTHFTSRGFQCASSISATVRKSRDEFCEQWRGELESGQLCIVAWYEDKNAGLSYGDVVVGAEDEEHLTEMLSKIRSSTEQVTF